MIRSDAPGALAGHRVVAQREQLGRRAGRELRARRDLASATLLGGSSPIGGPAQTPSAIRSRRDLVGVASTVSVAACAVPTPYAASTT